tara:strand:- start:2243 stop:2587 length:345 start_codon:yes stop_codon:yes gene_type:complete
MNENKKSNIFVVEVNNNYGEAEYSHYIINGIAKTRLRLKVGIQYEFHINAKHYPFYITEDVMGGEDDTSDAQEKYGKAIDDGIFTFTPTKDMRGKTLYYHSTRILKMGYKINIV